MRGLDWQSLTQSGGPVSHDMEVFYPQNRFINFYIVPLVIEHREAVVTIPREESDPNESARGRYGTPGSPNRAMAAEEVGHGMILRDITQSRRTAQQTIESERLNALTLLPPRVPPQILTPLNPLHIPSH